MTVIRLSCWLCYACNTLATNGEAVSSWFQIWCVLNEREWSTFSFFENQSFTFLMILVLLGFVDQLFSEVFWNTAFKSSNHSAPLKMFAMSERLNSGFNILALFSPRTRTFNSSSLFARFENLFLGIQNFFSTSSRLNDWNSNRWSSNSTTGIHSMICPGVLNDVLILTDLTSEIQLQTLNTTRNDKAVFNKTAFCRYAMRSANWIDCSGNVRTTEPIAAIQSNQAFAIIPRIVAFSAWSRTFDQSIFAIVLLCSFAISKLFCIFCLIMN